METLFLISFWVCILYLLWCISYALYSYWDVHERVRPATNPPTRIHVDVWETTVVEHKPIVVDNAKTQELNALRAGLMGKKRTW